MTDSSVVAVQVGKGVMIHLLKSEDHTWCGRTPEQGGFQYVAWDTPAWMLCLICRKHQRSE